MRGEVTFGVNFSIEDRNPSVFTNSDSFTHKGKQFRTTHYRASGETWGALEGTWQWYRSGPILKDDGEPRKDGAAASRRIKATDVPLYARQALHAELVERAAAAHAEIDDWVQRAAEMAETVSS